MNKTIFVILAVVIFSIYLFAKDIPTHPMGVPKNANWNEHFKYWSVDGKHGSFKIWYPSGALKVDQIIVNDNYNKDIHYFEDGKIRTIGQNILLENIFKEKDFKFQWYGFGKWKRFNKNGILINEICYTQNFDADEGEWQTKACGVEINYNEDGSVKEKIDHKLDCKYGCEELECKDCIKK